MTTYYLNNEPLVEGADFTVGSFTYPYAWLETTSPQILASLGIVKHGSFNFDTKYYIDANTPKELEDSLAVDIEGNPVYKKVLSDTKDENGIYQEIDTDVRLVNYGLRSFCSNEVREKTNNLLSTTDYYIIRNSVEGSNIPADVSSYRAAVVAEQTRVTDAIAEVSDVEGLIEIMSNINWPATV